MMALFNRFDPAAFLAARNGHGMATADVRGSSAAGVNSVPSEWLDGFTRLCRIAGPPPDFPATRWNLITSDMAVFIDRWSVMAAVLGWTTLDLFGVGVEAPYHRVDLMGLVPMTGGRAVVALTETAARLRCGDGTIQAFYR